MNESVVTGVLTGVIVGLLIAWVQHLQRQVKMWKQTAADWERACALQTLAMNWPPPQPRPLITARIDKEEN